jgi:hypothetical protein
VKIPIGTRKGKDGETEVVLGYAPLAYCLPYMAADMAAVRVKMALLGAKGRLSKQMRDAAMAEGMAVGEGAGTIDQLAAAGLIPKKWYGIAKVLQGMGVNVGGKGPTTHAGQSGGSEYRPGL